MRFHNTTLGKAVASIEKTNKMGSEIIEQLYLFVKVFNRSKHEVNQSYERSRLFNPKDALVSYFTVRILGSLY